MKHFFQKAAFTLASLLACAVPSAAQNHVSKELSPRNVLIEEYTGIHCSICPQGHRTCHNLKLAYPDQVFCVNIHAGNYAMPSGRQPDLRTSEGDYLYSHFGITSMPGGLINRLDFDGKKGIYPPQCAEQVRSLLPLKADVNMWAEAEYDDNTKKLTVNVESYFLKNKPGARLSVYVAQNNISSYQSGVAVNVYLHSHVLRKVMTANLGDILGASEEGETVTKSLCWTLPEDINGTPLNPRALEVIAFITNADGEIENVTHCYPSMLNTEPQNMAVISEPFVSIDSNWAYNFFYVLLENRNDTPLTSALFEISLKNKKASVDWSGEIPPRSIAQVKIPIPEEIALPATYKNAKYIIKLKQSNDMEALTDCEVSGLITSPSQYPSDLTFHINPATSHPHNTWTLYKADGSVFKTFEATDNTPFAETLTLPDGVYCFEGLDLKGDANSLASFAIKDSENNTLSENTLYNFGNRHFFRVGEPASLKEIGADSTPGFTLNGCILYATAPDTRLTLYNTAGTSIKSGIGHIDMSVIPHGLYILSLRNASASTVAKIAY